MSWNQTGPDPEACLVFISGTERCGKPSREHTWNADGRRNIEARPGAPIYQHNYSVEDIHLPLPRTVDKDAEIARLREALRKAHDAGAYAVKRLNDTQGASDHDENNIASVLNSLHEIGDVTAGALAPREATPDAQ